MGLSEGKRKTRLVGSAVTNNAAWTNDASLPGQRLLSSMGWTQGQGLGTSSQGSAVPIKMAFKMDNKGIGARRHEREARANGVADAWVGGAGQLGDLFERLNQASASGTHASTPGVESDEDGELKKTKSKKRDKQVKGEKKSRKGKEKEIQVDGIKVEEAVQKVASALPHRMAHRARFLKAKRMVGNDLASVNEILGIASPAGQGSPVPEAVIPVEAVDSGSTTPSQDANSIAEAKESNKKRKREEREKDEERKARREAKRLAKDAKERRKKKKRKQTDAASQPADGVIDVQAADASTDPSFAAGGGMKVSSLSVHEYLQRQLMKRKAAIIRRKRDEEASLWSRAATVCT